MQTGKKRVEIAIIGSGVSGLTCGVRLLQQGLAVTIFARELPPHTTSDVAPALWLPYKVQPQHRVLPWAKTSFLEFQKLVTVAEAGVRMATLFQFFTQPISEPFWRTAVDSFNWLRADELPPDCVAGCKAEVPLIETPIYVPWLRQRFLELGGQLKQRTVADLKEFSGCFPLVVNCSGVWARHLVADAAVFPIRGQIVCVRRPAEMGPAMLDKVDTAITYIVPRTHDCLLGGTADENSWDLEPNPDTAQAILQRCAELVPQLKTAEILVHKVGLRPGRSEVRLEFERGAENMAIIHNYGHGGAGFTLSWGCAEEVATLTRQFLSER